MLQRPHLTDTGGDQHPHITNRCGMLQLPQGETAAERLPQHTHAPQEQARALREDNTEESSETGRRHTCSETTAQHASRGRSALPQTQSARRPTQPARPRRSLVATGTHR